MNHLKELRVCLPIEQVVYLQGVSKHRRGADRLVASLVPLQRIRVNFCCNLGYFRCTPSAVYVDFTCIFDAI